MPTPIPSLGSCSGGNSMPPRSFRYSGPQTAALVMGAEEILAAGRRHRSPGADLQAPRRRRDDLGEAVHLPRTGAVDRGEPVARGGKRRAAADGADLETGKPDRGVDAACDA